MLYNGFISYSHAADGKLAPALQRALHILATPWYRRRSLRLFRDQASLSANPALWPAIEQALGQSEWFLFMASPQSAQSHWVRKELQWWLDNRSSDKILILLTGGDLSWDREKQDFDWTCTAAVPDLLRRRFPDEPLHVDLRWAGKEDILSIRHLQFRGAVLDIAAPLHGKAKDELDGEDVRQLRRNKAWAWSAAGAMFILAVAATTAAYQAIAQRDEARRQSDIALGRQLRAEAQRLAPVDTQWATAMLLAIEGSRRAKDAGSYEVLWKLMSAGARRVGRVVTKQQSGARPAFSPDGQAVATEDGHALVVSEARGGREIKRIELPGMARFVGFNATGDRIAAAGDDYVRVFALSSGIEIARHDNGRGVFAFSADGDLLAVATATKVKVMEVFSGRVLFDAEIANPVGKIVVGAGGKKLALISGTKAWLLDTSSGRSTTLAERGNDISAVTFNTDATLVAVASFKNEDVVVTDTATGKERGRFAPGATGAWFNPHRDYLVTQKTDGTSALYIQDLERNLGWRLIKTPRVARVINWSRDGELLVVGTDEPDGSTNVYRFDSGHLLARLYYGAVGAEAVAVSPNGELIASRANGMTTIFETDQGALLARFGKPNKSTRVTVSADGKIIAGAVAPNGVLAFAAGSDRPLARLDDCDGSALSLSGDGRRLVAGCRDGQARVVDTFANEVIGSVPHRFGKLILSPDGAMVLSIGPQGAAIFAAEGENRQVRRIGGDSITAAAFDLSAKRLVVASGNVANVYETSGTQKPRQLDAGALIESVAVSPDGSRVALGARGHFAKVYDIDTGQQTSALDHMEEETKDLRVRAMVFSGDGRMLATAATDATNQEHAETGATLHVFDVPTAKELIRVPLPEWPLSIGFSSDQRFLDVAVGGENIRLLRFPIHTEAMIQSACARLGRNLSENESQRYFGDPSHSSTCAELNPAAAPFK